MTGILTLDDKQPSEAYYIKFDFTNAIGSAAISTATVTAIDSLGVDAVAVITDSDKQSIVTPYVNVWVRGGVHKQNYTITCKITTDAVPSEIYELEAEVPVREKTQN